MSKYGDYVKTNAQVVSSALSGDIAGVIGSLGGYMSLFGSSSNSAKKSFEYSKQLQQHQYDLYRQSRQTAYQDTRQDLEAAGYNPLLAVGAQSSGISPSAALQVTDEKTERLQNALNTASAIANIKNLKSQNKLNEANSAAVGKNVDINERRLGMDTLMTQAKIANDNRLTSAEVAKKNAETEGILINNNYERTFGSRERAARIQSALSGVNLNSASVGEIKARADISTAEAAWIKKHPLLYHMGQFSNRVLTPASQSYSNFKPSKNVNIYK